MEELCALQPFPIPGRVRRSDEGGLNPTLRYRFLHIFASFQHLSTFLYISYLSMLDHAGIIIIFTLCDLVKIGEKICDQVASSKLPTKSHL